MITHYAVAYDRPTSKGFTTIHCGDFVAVMDTASLVKQMTDEGKQNVRLRSRQISDYTDVDEGGDEGGRDDHDR